MNVEEHHINQKNIEPIVGAVLNALRLRLNEVRIRSFESRT
jgi:hypothetical protein